MKIGLVCPYGWDTPGGVQSHVRELADWFITKGHEVSVLAPVSDEESISEKYLVNAGKPLAIPFNGSTARILFGPIASARVKSWISENEFDVLHLHEPAMPSLSLLSLWAGEGPMVGTFHAQMERVKAISAIGSILDPAIEKLTAKIAVSQAARETLKERYETEAVVIPNGVEVKQYANLPENRFDHLQGNSKELKVGFIGRFDEPRKGLSVLLPAWQEVIKTYPKAQLFVAGPSDEKVLRNLLNKCGSAVQESVKFLGRLSEAEKVAFFHNLDIYIAPNTGGESFGIILVEAMAGGAPIVASDLDAFKALLPEGEIFENENSVDLAKKIIALGKDVNRLQHLSEFGVESAKKFDWDVVGEAVLDIYQIATTGYPKVHLSSASFLKRGN